MYINIFVTQNVSLYLKMPLRDELLNIADLVKKTGMSRSTINRRIKDGSLKPISHGSINLYSYKQAINLKNRKK